MSEPIRLLTGDYYIQMHDEHRRFIGVDPRLPMYPHALCALPDGQQPLWHIQNLDGVRYVIKLHNSATVVQGDSVVAQPTKIPHQWIVQHIPSKGQFAYVILNNYPGEVEDTAWSLDSSDPYTRVKLRKASVPGDLPKGSLFNILPLVNKVAPTGTAPQPARGTLPNGRYLIKKHGPNGGFIAVDEKPGEDPIERQVFVLPGGTRAPIWNVEDVNNGIYAISSGDWITGSGAGGTRVLAQRAPFMPQQWRLQAFPLEGENCYMVHTGSVSGNPTWAMESSKPYTPVDLKKIGPFSPEDPPQDTLFDFIPVPEADGASLASVAAPDIVIELPAGRYLIKRHGVQDGYIAVKDSAQELRPVVVLPGGTQAPVWNIAAPNFGTYEISSEGFDTRPDFKSTAVVAGGVSIQQGRWHLHRFPQQGKDCYMIIDEVNTGLSWAVTKPESYAPVELREIGVFAPELPPKEALFDIIPVPDDATSTGAAPPKVVLPAGEYLIKKHGAHSDYIAVKAGTDEFRPVITLPAGTQAPKWNIGAANPGRYEISSGGMETHPRGDKIIAGGVSIMQGQWFLRHYPLKGQFCYMIVSDMDPNMGWEITQAGAYAPVEFREVGFFAPELPPPEFLFDLVPVKRA